MKSYEVPVEQAKQFGDDHPPVAEWEEAPTRGEPEYSCETDCVKRIVTGPIADDVRRKLGAPPDAEVVVTERTHSYGYSTLTQENNFECLIECAGVSKELYSHWGQWNSLPSIIEWLTEPEVPPRPPAPPAVIPAAFQFPRRML
ncbi:hypothetical protein A5N78_04590 [Prescottella equi]|uniref:hypothetical protein n=1 Tax=Rhodococcus hoagii TaxID=43767 RepID=UPI000A0F9634|nr:hypothetical protein [Prescottella equi]ORL93418.1 hypothetical protein A5N78_04590 [Prescottella equi]ORM17771.1 hypothetical protein A5N70_11165 [Prescottella equi]